jgi:hypothetical protein
MCWWCEEGVDAKKEYGWRRVAFENTTTHAGSKTALGKGKHGGR